MTKGTGITIRLPSVLSKTAPLYPLYPYGLGIMGIKLFMNDAINDKTQKWNEKSLC